MKTYLNITLWIILAVAVAACTSGENEMNKKNLLAETIADSLKQIYAPDSRTELISCSFKASGQNLILSGETTHPDFRKTLLKELSNNNILIIDSLITLPGQELGGLTWALINVSVANIRAEAGHSREQVTQVILGHPVRVYKAKNNWYYIQTAERYLGWVDEAAIHLMTSEQLRDWRLADRALFQGDFAIVREEAREQSPAVSDIVLGAIITTQNNGGSWTEISMPDGRKGFLKPTYLAPFDVWKESVKASPDDFEKLGFELLGRPYLWGGTSVKGMDCSGFVKTIYASGGLILERDASQQIRMGNEIPVMENFSNLKKGDLLFFGRKSTETSKERITHVGMCLENGRFIHASGRVRINSLDPSDPFYSSHLDEIFVRAKRVIDPGINDYPFSFNNHPWY